MDEFREAYLDEDWEETTHHKLGGMTQGRRSFWNYAIEVQAKNSLLTGTASHLASEQLRHCIEAGMTESLSCRCVNVKINKEVDIKKWLGEVKRVDDTMRAEHREFEAIATASRESSRKANPLGEPSNCANTQLNRTTTPRTATPLGKLPKLTETERQLLFDNDGCLKCHRFFVAHKSANCPNNWPNATNYRMLTQGDVDRAHTKGKTVAAIASVSDDSMEAHPVTAVLGSLNAPTAYLPKNASSIIERGDESISDISVSPPPPYPRVPAMTQTPLVGRVMASMAAVASKDPLPIPFYKEHLYWRCSVEGNSPSAPTMTTSLLDNGCHTVLIEDDLATTLTLKRRKLYKPETVCLAITASGEKGTKITLTEWVKLKVSDLNNAWTARTVRAIVCPGLCAPITHHSWGSLFLYEMKLLSTTPHGL
jgi:hypothetical protein